MTARGPRRRLDEDQRRGQIIGGAVSVLAERGYDGASLSSIAEAAGVSKGLISHYFDGRDDLMAETAVSAARRMRDDVAAQLDLSRPVPEVIRAALRHAAHYQATHGAELAALRQIIANLRRPDGSARLTMDDYAESYAAQQKLFRRGQAEGSLSPDLDVTVLAITYQSAIDAMIAHLDAHPETDPDTYADALADILLAGLLTRPT